ncbi:hypothetical protein G5B31_20670, partial [Rhodobacter sp. SGA-6-6]|uniref:hypothetical protein n=1 Tax=Rhodobacter sp. SGA-6-6 TaxID=2710882 RepID=UPI0013FBFA69
MTMKQKRSNEPGKMPLIGDLADGQIAMNTHDAALFMRKTVGVDQSVVRVGAEMSAAVAATLKEATLPAFRAAIGVVGDGQSWQNVEPERSAGTTYSNATGRAIIVAVAAAGPGATFSVRPPAGSWVEVAVADGADHLSAQVVVPAGHDY